MSASRRYRAFMSYSHSDARLAEKLHRALESYSVPKRLRGTAGEFGPVPERLDPIFRDRDELASSGDLGTRVREALDESDALIAICSPEAARSRWVNEEILAFKRAGRSRRIYCVIAGGEPNAGDERECFAPALRFEIEADGRLGERRAEPVAADVRPGGDGHNRARYKLIAGLLGVGLDTLLRREAQRRHRRMALVAAGSFAGMALALALATTAWIARNNARQQQALAEAASRDAQRRQAQAEGLLGFLLDDLRPKLEKVGRLDLLDTVDEKAETYFSDLDPRDLNDNTLVRQAQTLTDMGQVRLKQGRFPDALASFLHAYVRSNALVDRHPGDGARLFDRGQAEYWVGYVDLQARDVDQAQVWLTRYRDTSRAAHALDPKNTDWEREVAYADHALAVLELDRGRLEDALAAFQRARSTFESLLARNPDDPDMMFDVADEISWEGNAQEQLGHLARATELLAGKSERLRMISTRNPNNPRWKAEWSTAQLLQSNLLRIRGRYAEALTIADEAVERMKPLTVLDPSNKKWSQDYLYALLIRAAARIGAGERAPARADLAAAQPLLDALAHTESQDRHVRRDVLEAASLRILLALQERERSAVRAAADALRSLDPGKPAAPSSTEDAGRYALAQVAAGMAALDAGRHSDAEVYLSTARRVLEPLAQGSHYWRVLDPWVRLSLLGGDRAVAEHAQAQLAADGYVPLFAWPGARGAAATHADAARAASRAADSQATDSNLGRSAANLGAISPDVATTTPPQRLQP